DELTVDGMVLRYRTEETDDGMRGEEGTFTICSFWLVSALCEIGELDRARELCEKLLSYASPLQLYAEEIDPRSGRHPGNSLRAGRQRAQHRQALGNVDHGQVVVDVDPDDGASEHAVAAQHRDPGRP